MKKFKFLPFLKYVCEKITQYIDKNLCDKICVNEIKNSDGRTKASLECCKSGSYIYFLYNKLDKVIYIGETDKSVKSRLFCDGDGSHQRKDWFKEVKYVRYYKHKILKNLDVRLLIERALILTYRNRGETVLYNDGSRGSDE